jgi:hypothetical protein
VAIKKSPLQEGKKGRRMTAQRNRTSNETRASIEEEHAQEQEPLLLCYAKWIGDSKSLSPMLGSRRKLWVMRCPLRSHPSKVRTLLLDPEHDHWWCTACAVHGDVVSLAARLNGFNYAEATQILDIYRQKMTRSVR